MSTATKSGNKTESREKDQTRGSSSDQSMGGGSGQSRSSSNQTSDRGFASMDQDKQKEIASQGGRAAHDKGTSHEFTPEDASETGRKGGQASSQQSDTSRSSSMSKGTGSSGGGSGDKGTSSRGSQDNQGQGTRKKTETEGSR